MARNPGTLVVIMKPNEADRYGVIYKSDIQAMNEKGKAKITADTKFPVHILETRKDEKGAYPGNPTGEKLMVKKENFKPLGMVD